MNTAGRLERSGGVGSWKVDALAVGLTLVALGAALVVGAFSDGVYMDDDITHYHFARDGWGNINALLNRWARPGYNIPTALVAHFFGLPGCRVFSALQTAAIAWFAYAIARRLIGANIYAALAVALVWVQPITFRLATTTLTETTGGVYLTIGVWLYLRGNRIWGCGVLSLMFVARDETMALGPIVAAAVILDALREAGGDWRKMLRTGWVWACAGATVWAPGAYWTAAWVMQLPPDASPLSIFSRGYSAEYGSGVWYWFLGIWTEQASVGVLALGVGGAVYLGRKAWFISGLVWGLVVLHSVIFARGMFASGGYSRFLVPISGLLGVLGAAGLKAVLFERRRSIVAVVFVCAAGWLLLVSYMFERYVAFRFTLALGLILAAAGVLAVVVRRPGFVRWWGRVAIAVMLLLSVGHFAAVTRPLRLSDSNMHNAIVDVLRDLEKSPHADKPALSLHVMIRHLRPGTETAAGIETATRKWQTAASGTLFFWESKYCNPPLKPQSTQYLKDELQRLGRNVFSSTYESCRAAVYLRNDTPGGTR
ncbi:MAG TPA: hypothetical protein ENH84_05520 [Phycisphaerae bacterium]|nr:hypothetical protein [Phycisphaerae bacterium]